MRGCADHTTLRPRLSCSLKRNAAAVLDLGEGVQWEASDTQLGSPDVPAFQGTLRLAFKEQLPACPPGSGDAPGGCWGLCCLHLTARSFCLVPAAALNDLDAAARSNDMFSSPPPPGSCRLPPDRQPAAPARTSPAASFTRLCRYTTCPADAVPDGGVTLRVQLFGGLTNVSYVDETLELLPGNVKWSVFVEGW